MRGFLAATCVVLAFASSVSAADKPAAPLSFADWLEQQTAPAVAKTVAQKPAYEEIEYDNICFSLSKYKNCRCIGCTDYCSEACPTAPCNNPPCCNTAYNEVEVSCCPEDGYGYGGDNTNLINTPTLAVGTCQVTAQSFDREDPVTVVAGKISKVGPSVITCELNGHHCDHPFCDSLVLTAHLMDYAIENAVSKTNPALPSSDDSCAPIQLWDCDDRKTPAAAGPASGKRWGDASSVFEGLVKAGKVPAAAKKGGAGSRNEGGSGGWYGGKAIVSTGPATITSRKYNIKHSEGYLEFASFAEGTPISDAQAAEGFYVHRPWSFNLKMRSPPRREY